MSLFSKLKPKEVKPKSEVSSSKGLSSLEARRCNIVVDINKVKEVRNRLLASNNEAFVAKYNNYLLELQLELQEVDAKIYCINSGLRPDFEVDKRTAKYETIAINTEDLGIVSERTGVTTAIEFHCWLSGFLSEFPHLVYLRTTKTDFCQRQFWFLDKERNVEVVFTKSEVDKKVNSLSYKDTPTYEFNSVKKTEEQVINADYTK